ncbi:MAG: hypothetical protein JWP45_1107 [Mucilaginibacter sp.]|jgi:hypothetical protein|nr:hypothetical protein [Mucilaginibacter sp.]
MRNYKNIFWVAIISLACGISACKKYEQFPVDKQTLNIVFDKYDSLGTNAHSYLNSIYALLRDGHNVVATDYLDAASDDAVSSAAGSTNQVTVLSTAAYNSSTLPANENVWSGTASYWAGIRMANEFVSNIGVVPVQQTYNGYSMKYTWKSEARFLRAYFYFELVKRFGGVPLLGDKVYSINDNISLPRNSFSDCINYITSECDAIKDSMLTNPIISPNAYYGRATKGAAMALKARVLLYAASPLFNGGNIDAANPLTGYTNADQTRWVAAAQAAQDVINLNVFSLDQSFKDVFLTQNNPEIIFIRQGDNGNTIESANGPVGFPAANGLGRTSPTQDLVDAFPMNNGLPITDVSSGYDSNNPYANRDPRLSYTVLYNGAQWLNTQLQTFEGGQSKPNTGQQQTLTSYYMRKFMGNFENANAYGAHNEDWVILRYAEVLLDYAEAENEALASPNSNVYSTIISLRKRAGINAGSDGMYGLKAGMTQADMRAVIQNERRIELAFEESRYFDIRRWKIAETVMNQPRRGETINQSGNATTYNIINVLTTKFTQPKMYLYPIPYDEVLKNPNMKQNPGW